MVAIKEGVVADAGLAGVSSVEVDSVVDPRESGHRWRYRIVELLIYFGWPTFVAAILMAVGLNKIASGLAGALVFSWPYLKGLIGALLARKTKGDPRLRIRSLFWFDGFLFVGSPFLREIRQYSALGRSLDVIYNFFGRFDKIRPKKFPDDGWVQRLTPFGFVNGTIKRWTGFWGNMPIAQDVRTRLEIIAEEFYRELCRLSVAEPGRTINILEVAGGTLQDVIMGIARAMQDGAQFNYRVFSIEPDGNFAKERALELIQKYGLEVSNFEFIVSRISLQNPQRALRKLVVDSGMPARFDMVVCVGLGDYYYSLKRITGLLSHLDIGHKIIVANISDNLVERGFLHFMIQWPKMQYRSLEEWISILRHVWPSRRIKIVQTPHKIFNIAIVG